MPKMNEEHIREKLLPLVEEKGHEVLELTRNAKWGFQLKYNDPERDDSPLWRHLGATWGNVNASINGIPDRNPGNIFITTFNKEYDDEEFFVHVGVEDDETGEEIKIPMSRRQAHELADVLLDPRHTVTEVERDDDALF